MTNHSPESVEPFTTEFHDARILRVVDADTFDVEIDLGFNIRLRERVRLIHDVGRVLPKIALDAYEVRGIEKVKGKAAVEYVKACLWASETNEDFAPVRLATTKDPKRSKGKYGRWLAYIVIPLRQIPGEDADDHGLWTSLGDALLKAGHAVEKTYR